MKLSNSNLYISDFPEKGNLIIYNLYNKKIFKMKDCNLLDNIESINPSTLRLLSLHKIIFKDHLSEKQFIKDYFNNELEDGKDLNIILLLTNNCNFKCKYCFEKDLLERHRNIETEEIENLKRFTSTHMKKNHLDKLNITFYGGEPLLEKQKLKDIVNFYYSSLKDNFSFNIITNGSLLDYELINELKDKNLVGLKVTLDGPEEIHNKRRPMSKGNSYITIINNLMQLKSIVPLKINIVVDSENTNFIKDMIPHLKLFLSEKDEVQINPTRLVNAENMHIRSQNILNIARLLKQENIIQGNAITNYDGGTCFGKKSNHFVVDVDGDIYNCPAFLGMKKCSTGNVRDFYKDIKLGEPESCYNCRYLPVCYGGCLHENYLNDKITCPKEYLDLVATDLIKIYLS